MVASVFCQIRGSDPFSKFIWWTVAYEFICITFVAWTIVQDVKQQFAVAVRIYRINFISHKLTVSEKIVGYLAVSAGFLTLSINSLVFSSAGERVANSVGLILLSIVTV